MFLFIFNYNFYFMYLCSCFVVGFFSNLLRVLLLVLSIVYIDGFFEGPFSFSLLCLHVCVALFFVFI
jgi:hypothetical protein